MHAKIDRPSRAAARANIGATLAVLAAGHWPDAPNDNEKMLRAADMVIEALALDGYQITDKR